MKKAVFIGVLSLIIINGCIASIGVGTGFNIGGIGVGVSTSASKPITKKNIEETKEKNVEKTVEVEKKAETQKDKVENTK